MQQKKYTDIENAARHKKLFKIFFLEKEGATKVAVFGSYARGEEKQVNDLDILVEFSETKGLLTLCGLRGNSRSCLD